MRARALLWAVLLAAAACQAGTGSGNVSEREVPLQVVQGRGGSTLALIPVTVHGEGPFAFALDTGASESVLDTEIVRRLGLTVVEGSERPASGISGTVPSRVVRIDRWRIGDLDLPGQRIRTLDLPDGEQTIDGLLGSDVLSGFRAVTIDYADAVLRVREVPGTPP